MNAEPPHVAARYRLKDGRVLCVTTELGRWSVWLADDANSQVNGFPLEGVIAEAIGLDPAHDDMPEEVAELAERIRSEVSIEEA